MTKQGNEGKETQDTASQKGIVGSIKELGTHVFVAGLKQQHHYTKIVKAIAQCAGKECGVTMRNAALNANEISPAPPPEPPTEDATNPIKMKIFEMEHSQCKEELKDYKLHKEKVFVIILGQCNQALVNQVEARSEHQQAEKDADIPALLNMIKELVHSTKGTQCAYWTLSHSLRRLTTSKQFKQESLAAHCNRFMDLVNVAEAQWGELAPLDMTLEADGAIKKNPTDDEKKESRLKCLACVHMAGANQQKHGGCIAELNNSFLSGNDKFPKSPSNALEFLNNHMTGEQPSKQHNKKTEEKDETVTGEVNFAQKSTLHRKLSLQTRCISTTRVRSTSSCQEARRS